VHGARNTNAIFKNNLLQQTECIAFELGSYLDYYCGIYDAITANKSPLVLAEEALETVRIINQVLMQAKN
jgi:hypothetical protein